MVYVVVRRAYEVKGKLLKAVHCFYVDCMACILVKIVVSEWFLINVQLRHDCVMSSWLFLLYMDDVVCELNARVLVEC